MATSRAVEIARAFIWRGRIEEIRNTHDIKRWRAIRKSVNRRVVSPQMLRVFDALRPTRKERRVWRDLARAAAKHHSDAIRPLPKAQRPLCGAKTRAGGTCRAKVCARPDGQGMATKCRLHGGASTGATPEGRKAIAHSNSTRTPPTKYSPGVCALVLSELAGGASVARSCRAAGVSVQTFYNWQEKHPDFAEAVAAVGRPDEEDIYQVLGIPRGLAAKLERMN